MQAVVNHPPSLEKENHPACSTYVIFDIETTGLSNTDRITELAMVAVHRNDLISWNYVSKGKKKTSSPRVTNKLVLCFNPQRFISSKVEKLTGLSNSNLSSQTEFSADVVDTITQFLKRLEQPVCMVAHYGDGFDFPRFVQEIANCQADIPDVFTADSINLFRFLESGNLELPSSPTGSSCLSIPRYVSYKLPDIYKRRVGTKPAVQHGAEADCYTLLALVKIGGRAALNWLNENAISLSNYRKTGK